MPLYESFGKIFDDFPQLLFSEMSLFFFSETNLPIKGENIRLVGDLS